ncbi:hypothetical protein CR513_54495, partial [Mucuna pruriens]
NRKWCKKAGTLFPQSIDDFDKGQSIPAQLIDPKAHHYIYFVNGSQHTVRVPLKCFEKGFIRPTPFLKGINFLLPTGFTHTFNGKQCNSKRSNPKPFTSSTTLSISVAANTSLLWFRSNLAMFDSLTPFSSITLMLRATRRPPRKNELPNIQATEISSDCKNLYTNS